jgi:N-acetylglucosaminyldiphosphoundecaprenol N-acetyl-beta-D-mannosaminyltransferase
MYKTVHLFGLDFISAQNHADIIEHMMDYRKNPDYVHKLPFVITPNADQIVKLDKAQHHALKEKLTNALFILPDGYPIIWFSRLVRKPLKARLTGSDLFPILWQNAKRHSQKIFVIVSHESLGLKLKQDYDNTVYYAPPFFELQSAIFDNVCQEIIDKIKDFKPQYVIIGIGFPKQEWLGLAIHNTLKEQAIPSPLFLCLGASAEFFIGIKKRAPLFLQKVGLEWLYRLLQEPKRMWRRYILGAIFLLRLYVKELKKEFSRKKSSA